MDKLTQNFIRKMPFIKALLISELNEGVEVYKYASNELNLQQENEKFVVNISSLRAAMNSLYQDFKSQFAKVCSCENFKISMMYDQYFVQKVKLGKNILLIVICETENNGQATLNIG